MTVAVLIPHRPGDSHRERLMNFTRMRLHEVLHMDDELLFMDDREGNADLFNHGEAINRAAVFANAKADVYLIADADTTYDDPDALLGALDATSRDRKWRLPSRYVQLNENATEALIASERSDWPTAVEWEDRDVEWVGDRVSWSGLVIVPKEAFLLVRGSDERYAGWGADDIALGLALDTLYGRHERFDGAAVHLWHPRGVQEQGLHRFAEDGRTLTDRYREAAGKPEAMWEIVGEKRDISELAA